MLEVGETKKKIKNELKRLLAKRLPDWLQVVKMTRDGWGSADAVT